MLIACLLVFVSSVMIRVTVFAIISSGLFRVANHSKRIRISDNDSHYGLMALEKSPELLFIHIRVLRNTQDSFSADS